MAESKKRKAMAVLFCATQLLFDNEDEFVLETAAIQHFSVNRRKGIKRQCILNYVNNVALVYEPDCKYFSLFIMTSFNVKKSS